jgi:hypothetical protein
MRVVVTVTREFFMDESRVLSEPDFEPPSPDATNHEKRQWLRESFFELCGFDRDRDHVDGSFVEMREESGEDEFDWPEALRG